MALLRLADAVLQRYGEAKARRAALDFDDLIAKSGQPARARQAAVEWVLYKLDGGLDHILVDEAQDTSPVQWQVDPRAGRRSSSPAPARASEARTLFAVGDEKQSIYGFQGAAPEHVRRDGRGVRRACARAARTAVAARAARPVVPHRRRRCWTRSTASSPTASARRA